MSALRRSIGAALFVAAACNSRSTESVGTARDGVIDGALDPGDPGVVMIFVYADATDDVSDTCTGTVVSPHVVLTAAHCVYPDIAGPIDRVAIYLADTSKDATKYYDPANYVAVASYETHPSFVGTPKDDIALLVTDETIPSPPVAINRTPMTVDDEGRPVRILGYGQSIGGDVDSAYYRRQASTTIHDVLDSRFSSVGVICNGDSGGPTLGTANGVESILGVHSIGTDPSCVGDAYDTRADVYAASFIDPRIEAVDPGFLVEDEAGGGGQGGTGGSGGAGGAADDEAPLDASTEDGCSLTAASSSPRDGAWMWGPLAAAVVVARRRRPLSRLPRHRRPIRPICAPPLR